VPDVVRVRVRVGEPSVVIAGTAKRQREQQRQHLSAKNRYQHAN
jgi:hypothetical protein